MSHRIHDNLDALKADVGFGQLAKEQALSGQGLLLLEA
jgi:hypothetical protein